MGERKVLNKYIPADFDPKLVPRGTKPKDDLVPVRMMLPFSIQCSSCSSFLYRGRKFNSKKEPVSGAEGKYLGIQRFRFYIKCTDCSRPITFLTDPKNADYEMESGATRNYEVWHDETKTNLEFDKNVEEEEKMDSMKALENRVLESQREMAELDNLEEIRSMNERHLKLMKGRGKGRGGGGGGGEFDAAKAVLEARDKTTGGVKEQEELNEYGMTMGEENMVQSINFGTHNRGNDENTGLKKEAIRRLDEEDELLAEKERQREAAALVNNKKQRQKISDATKRKLPIFKVRRKKRKDVAGKPPATLKNDDHVKRAKPSAEEKVITKTSEPLAALKKDNDSSSDSGGGGGGLSGLLGYGSGSSTD